MQLGTPFAITLEAPHVVDMRRQVWAGVVGAGPGGTQLNVSASQGVSSGCVAASLPVCPPACMPACPPVSLPTCLHRSAHHAGPQPLFKPSPIPCVVPTSLSLCELLLI